MKKLLLALTLFMGGLNSAFATCAGPAVLHDFPGSAFNMSYATNAGDGNCSPNVNIIGTLPAFASPPAVTLSGTLPAYGTPPTFNLGTNSALVAGSAIIGKVGIDPTANGTQDASTSATGSAVPSKAIYTGAIASGNLVGIIQADNSVPISISTAVTTQLVALSSGKKIYVTAADVVAGGTGNFSFVYGTGSNCGTGTTALTGIYPLTAQSGLSKGGGLGPIWVVPASNALCATTSAAVQMSGSVSYTQF